MIIETIPQIAQLSMEQKLTLADELYEDIAANAGPDDFPLTPEQELELKRRLREARANPGGGIPVEEAFARVMADLDAMQAEKSTHG